jgi:hypothetical protein
MKFKDTIGIFDNVFTKDECNALMDRFETAHKEGLSYEGKSGGTGVNKFKKSNDYNILGTGNDVDISLSDLVMAKFNSSIDNYLSTFPYRENYNHNRLVYGNTYYPLLQMQKYDKGKGHYNAWHVEVEGTGSMMRAFVFILYLNDVSEGGETGFLFKEEGEDDFFKVKPKQGTLIIHPASWPYIHKGYMPKSSDKYILTTWLQYTD